MICTKKYKHTIKIAGTAVEDNKMIRVTDMTLQNEDKIHSFTQLN